VNGRLLIILSVVLLLVLGFAALLSLINRPPAEPPRELPPGVPTYTPTLTQPASLPFWRRATATYTITPTDLPTQTPVPSPTRTPTRTFTPTSTATPTPVPAPQLNVLIATCDTGFDVLNRLGEVTNAYITVQNVGEITARDVLVVLSASDEEQAHADRSYQIGYLPTGHEISLKLTVDTQTGVDTRITVTVTNPEGIEETAQKEACLRRTPDRRLIGTLGDLFRVRPIQ
jgi:hypothetical protein